MNTGMKHFFKQEVDIEAGVIAQNNDAMADVQVKHAFHVNANLIRNANRFIESVGVSNSVATVTESA